MRIQLQQNLAVQTLQLTQVELELQTSIAPEVAEHWDKKIAGGIIPTEIIRKGQADPLVHRQEMEKLVRLETESVSAVFDDLWEEARGKGRTLQGREVHYVGIGTGEGLKIVSKIANDFLMEVIAYDISTVACENARKVFAKIAKTRRKKNEVPVKNSVLQGDIETICQPHVITRQATLLVLPNVLDVLNVAAKDPQKAQRTIQRIGALLEYLHVLAIFRRPEDNPNAIWGDTEPITDMQITHWMKEGLEGKVWANMLGTREAHGHTHVAFSFKRNNNREK